PSLLPEPIRSWTCRFPPFPAVLVQFARVFQSATGIIVFSQLAIATADDTEELIFYVEALWFVIGQIYVVLSISVADLALGHGVLSASAKWPGKRRLFCRRLFLVHRGDF